MKTKSLLILLFSTILIVLLNASGLFDTLNDKIYDNFIAFNQLKSKNNDIVIIKIDPISIQQLGSWPWNRKYYVQLIKKLQQAKPTVIAFNLAFTDKMDSKSDDELKGILKVTPDVIINAKLEPVTYKSRTILTHVKSIFPDVKEGQVYIKYTSKGVIRSFFVYKLLPAFALEILNNYYAEYSDHKTLSPELIRLLKFTENNQNLNSQSILIDYKRTPEQFESILFKEVLSDKVDLSIFKDKIVLIGLTDKSRTTVYSTPFTGINSLSSTPVELQAQIIDSLINFRNLQQVPGWIVYIISIAIAFTFFFITRKQRILNQGIYFIILLSVMIVIDYLLFKDYALFLPPVLMIILLISTFTLSIYFTTTKIDTDLNKTIDKIQTDQNLPLIDIPEDINSRVDSITSLLDIVNNDRQTIKAIINGVNNGIMVFDEKGKILWANNSSLKIFVNSLVLESNIESLIPSISLDKIVKEIKENGFYKEERSLFDRDYVCIFNPIERLNQYVVIFNDVTELKEIDRLKTEMMRMVSHELKNPLMVIQICSETISELSGDGKIDHNNTKIFNASAMMIDTINNFLNLNKLESGLMEINIQPSDLCKLIEDVISLQQTIASEKNIEIIFEKPSMPLVNMDDKLMTIVMNNLVSNAIKYSSKDSKVNVIVEKEEKNIKVSVIDSGLGIPAKDLDKIFDKFYRSENNKPGKIKGTGLGLSIVKKIITLHKGNITVESQENKGSSFIIDLPI